MRILLIIGLCLMAFSGMTEEKAEIYFVVTEHQFGTFSEDDGVRTYGFVFRNTGNAPLLIYEVGTSCGCTTPLFSRKPVLPGKVGRIEVAFHPEGRPGKFTKTIQVKSNAGEEIQLRISGEVTLTREPFPAYRYRVGDLKLKKMSCRMGMVWQGKPREERIAVVNTGGNPLVARLKEIPAFLSCSLEPEILQPGQEGDIVVAYLPGVYVEPGEHIGMIRMQLENVISGLLVDTSLTVYLNIQKNPFPR